MQPDAVASGAVEYRFDRASLTVGIVSSVGWGLAVIGVVAACLVNGVPRRELLAAILSVATCAGMCLLSAWLVLRQFRHRLRVTREQVHSVDVFRTRDVTLAQVRRIVWTPHFASVLLEENAARLRIRLSEYERRDQLELIRRIRAAFPDIEQEGWEAFELRIVPLQRDWTEVNAQFGPDGVEYRCEKESLWWATAATAIFGLATVGSVTAALLNFDGSFVWPIRPAAILCAAILGIGYGSIFAGCSWLLAHCIRHRLKITPDFVRATGAFGVREIGFAEVDRVVWKSTLRLGVVLRGSSSRIRIQFDDYARNDAAEIVHRIRSAVAGRREEGWDRFEAHHVIAVREGGMTPAQARRLWRFSWIACAASTAIATAALLWAKSVDEFSRLSWTAAALLPVTVFGIFAGLMWLMVRSKLVRSGELQKPV